MRRILVTGGAGFIGSHLTDRLLAGGYSVRILDNLCPQVHPEQRPPEYLDAAADLHIGDIRDAGAVEKALKNIDVVVHLVAAVGVGQSMYQIEHYTDVNNRGTAVLLEALAKQPVQKLIVASSMSIYGEGLYATQDGRVLDDTERTVDQLRRGAWEIRDETGAPLLPMATPETKRPCLSSVYALSKFDQERLCLLWGRTAGIPTTALRFFNVYGPRQALSNPYTGVLAIFAARLLNGQAPLIFEDGRQRRDFVSVHDVTAGLLAALENERVTDDVFNIGSGLSITIRDVAQKLARSMNVPIEAQLTGKYRAGDIRHCFADISKARTVLKYAPQVQFEFALEELASWLEGQTALDRMEEMQQELALRGLTL